MQSFPCRCGRTAREEEKERLPFELSFGARCGIERKSAHAVNAIFEVRRHGEVPNGGGDDKTVRLHYRLLQFPKLLFLLRRRIVVLEGKLLEREITEKELGDYDTIMSAKPLNERIRKRGAVTGIIRAGEENEDADTTMMNEWCIRRNQSVESSPTSVQRKLVNGYGDDAHRKTMKKALFFLVSFHKRKDYSIMSMQPKELRNMHSLKGMLGKYIDPDHLRARTQKEISDEHEEENARRRERGLPPLRMSNDEIERAARIAKLARETREYAQRETGERHPEQNLKNLKKEEGSELDHVTRRVLTQLLQSSKDQNGHQHIKETKTTEMKTSDSGRRLTLVTQVRCVLLERWLHQYKTIPEKLPIDDSHSLFHQEEVSPPTLIDDSTKQINDQISLLREIRESLGSMGGARYNRLLKHRLEPWFYNQVFFVLLETKETNHTATSQASADSTHTHQPINIHVEKKRDANGWEQYDAKELKAALNTLERAVLERLADAPGPLRQFSMETFYEFCHMYGIASNVPEEEVKRNLLWRINNCIEHLRHFGPWKTLQIAREKAHASYALDGSPDFFTLIVEPRLHTFVRREKTDAGHRTKPLHLR